MNTKELTINEANCRIKELDNKLEYYLNKKERAFNKTQSKTISITDDVKATTRVDKNMEYVIVCEEVDTIINNIQEEKNDLLNFIDKELHRLNEYRKVEQLVIYYKEQYKPKFNEEVTWYFIARKVHASESTCRRIYRKYKQKRSIEIE